MGQTHFFATRSDLLDLFATIEARRSLKYVPEMNSLSPTFPVFTRGAELPRLGEATCGDAIGCSSYLAADVGTAINVQELHPTGARPDWMPAGLAWEPDGEHTGAPPVRYVIQQGNNVDTIEFSPGGLWGGDCLLNGRIAVSLDTPSSRSLMNLFRRVIRDQFTNVNGNRVGPQALALWKAGKRLTGAAQSPREYDLSEG